MTAPGSLSLEAAICRDLHCNTGVEWNLRVKSRRAPQVHEQVQVEFESLWQIASDLSSELLTRYAANSQSFRTTHFEDERELINGRVHSVLDTWQIGAARCPKENSRKRILSGTRRRSYRYGKTWLAAFDARQIGSELSRRPRVLVIAHRAHILATGRSGVVTRAR